MGYPRCMLVNPLVGAVYHCASRCVRRASLIESSERCEWIVAQLEFLAEVFAIDVCDFAVMRNHVHLLLRTQPELAMAWSDEEVARRWIALARGADPHAEPGSADGVPLDILAAALTKPGLVPEWRSRLSDLGWFHKAWKEPAARIWNLQDGVTGHFWEGRYSSVGCAEETSVLMQATYILLNPVHCGLQSEIVDEPRSSVGRRLKALARSIEEGGHRQGVEAYERALLEPAIPCRPGGEVPTLSDAEWSRRLAERTHERALREAAVEEARQAANRARQFDAKALMDAAVAAGAGVGVRTQPPAPADGEPMAATETPPQPTPTASPTRAGRLVAPKATLLRSRAPSMPQRRLPDPPLSGGAPRQTNPWRDRSTLPLVDGCTLLAFVEFLDDRGRVERPDKRGRIDPSAPRAVDRLFAAAGRSESSREGRSSEPGGALAAAAEALDRLETMIIALVGRPSVASGDPPSGGGAVAQGDDPGPPPRIGWRGTLAGDAEAVRREAERRGMHRVVPIGPTPPARTRGVKR
jgi:hypothetical protein